MQIEDKMINLAPGMAVTVEIKTGQPTKSILENYVVRAAGLEPAQALRPHGFSYHFGFRRRPSGVRGLDYPFTLARWL